MTPTSPVRAVRLTYLFLGLLVVVLARPLSITDGTLAAAHNKPAVTAHGPGHAADASARADVDRAYGRLPLSFESNVGQTDAAVDFVARGTGYALFLTAGGGATFVLARGGAAATAAAPCDPHRAIGPRPSDAPITARMSGTTGANAERAGGAAAHAAGRDEWDARPR